MSALRQPNFSHEYYAPPLKQHQSNLVRNKRKKTQLGRTKVVKQGGFPQANNLPHNLKVLSLIQKASFGIAIASMTTSIGLYISTVQIPKIWSQEYQNLENLQRQERQLVSINETIKYQIAKEAGKNSKLEISNPESALFIQPAKFKAREDITNNQEIEQINLQYRSWGY